MLLILHRPQLEGPGEGQIPEVRVASKHFREQPPLSGGKENKQSQTLPASAGSRGGCSQSGKQNHCQCTLTGGERELLLRADGQGTIVRHRELEQM